jgi:hypothetical protein
LEHIWAGRRILLRAEPHCRSAPPPRASPSQQAWHAGVRVMRLAERRPPGVAPIGTPVIRTAVRKRTDPPDLGPYGRPPCAMRGASVVPAPVARLN